MGRAGLTPEVISRAAASLVDREGRAALTLARVADELGVRSPSLYSHVSGLGALERLVALDGIDRLTEACRTALAGRSGTDGLEAMARAYRASALAHPGVYQLTQVARPGDAEYEAQAGRLLDEVLALISGFGLTEPDLIHAARAVRSALHGFVMLELQGGFGLNVDINESFAWLMGSIERGLAISA